MTADQEQKLRDAIEASIRKEFPSFKIVPKEKSLFMRFLAKLLFFNPNFLTMYITVLNTKVYVPEGSNGVGLWRTLAHERVHMRQARKLTFPVFVLAFLFPQCLFLLSLLALGAIWGSIHWLWALLALLALAPWPAPFRARFELEAYKITLACAYWTEDGSLHPSLEERAQYIAEHIFAGSGYYFMARKNWAEARLLSFLHLLNMGGIPDEELHKLIISAK